MPTALSDATIFTGEAMVEGHTLLVEGGKVLDIVADRATPAGAPKISCAGQILAPGFIDAQVNGGGNILFNHAPTPESCIAIAKAHGIFRTTSLLPTCMTDYPYITKRAIVAAQTARYAMPIHSRYPDRRTPSGDGAAGRAQGRIAAWHDRERHAALPPRRRHDHADHAGAGIAPPETDPGPARTGHDVALGHTNASGQQVANPCGPGATGFTHLFNGMGGLHARDIGAAVIALMIVIVGAA